MQLLPSAEMDPGNETHKGSVNKPRDILEGNSGVSENILEREGTDSG